MVIFYKSIEMFFTKIKNVYSDDSFSKIFLILIYCYNNNIYIYLVANYMCKHGLISLYYKVIRIKCSLCQFYWIQSIILIYIVLENPLSSINFLIQKTTDCSYYLSVLWILVPILVGINTFLCKCGTKQKKMGNSEVWLSPFLTLI